MSVLRRPIYRNGKKFIVTADDDGKVNFNNLPGGLYHVQEIFPNDKIGCTAGIKKLHQQTAKMYLKDKNRSLFKLYHDDL
ncbi:prealbumin-like fold domain-containing protein [Lactobacillus delbrueckii]|uniref:prealbumin-like fold domain-containing protein n=1 Tax=Lactobacillus delbrueckii TaxID=1584 RepID=UPI001E616A36|nr:prealbumin-like fold domain-containing protein [Lactobacillus delbrueckii subsp. lactis]